MPRTHSRFSEFDDGELELMIARLEAEDVDDGPSTNAAALALEARIEQSKRRKHGNWSSSVSGN